MKREKLDEKLYQSRQDWTYESYWKLDKERLHIEIRRDAFDFQSHAICEIFDGKKWNRLVSLPHAEMKCLPVSYVMRSLRDEHKALFFEDEKALLDLAAKVLG